MTKHQGASQGQCTVRTTAVSGLPQLGQSRGNSVTARVGSLIAFGSCTRASEAYGYHIFVGPVSDEWGVECVPAVRTCCGRGAWLLAMSIGKTGAHPSPLDDDGPTVVDARRIRQAIETATTRSRDLSRDGGRSSSDAPGGRIERRGRSLGVFAAVARHVRSRDAIGDGDPHRNGSGCPGRSHAIVVSKALRAHEARR